MKNITKLLVLSVVAVVAACSASNSERARTEKLLGVKVIDLSTTQAFGEFDDVGTNAPIFNVAAEFANSVKADGDHVSDERSSVYASGLDGTVWEAYCGKAGAAPVVPPEVDFRPD